MLLLFPDTLMPVLRIRIISPADPDPDPDPTRHGQGTLPIGAFFFITQR
jgi:hypothetical protein